MDECKPLPINIPPVFDVLDSGFRLVLALLAGAYARPLFGSS